MLSLTLTLLALLAIAIAGHASGASAPEDGGTLGRALASRQALYAVFVLTCVVLWLSWAAWNPPPRVQDEMAYVLQAQIFALGRWANPSPPLPSFWEQPHVLVEPALASKYFPGHSLLLSLGALVGWPALVPLLSGSATGTLLFSLARKVGSAPVALLAWATWLFTRIVLYFGTSYYSETTTALCWLAGWYALLEWRSTRRTRWIVAVAFFTGWCAITRPLTAVAYALPIAAVVIREVIRGRRWRQLVIAFATGCCVVGVLPLWSARTTGSWRVTPQTLYTRTYMPYDVPGFGLDTTPPRRSLPPELDRLNDVYRRVHASHWPSALPSAFLERWAYLSVNIWGTTIGVTMVFAILGLFTLSGATAFALATALLLIVTYLSYATPPQWSLYYYETTPAFAYLTAAGVAWAVALIGRPARTTWAPSFSWRSPRWSLAMIVGTIALTLPGYVALVVNRYQHLQDRRPLGHFSRLVESIRPRAILFVRHKPDHSAHITLVRNVAEPARERVWVVYDRGDAENARLLAIAPDRRSFLYDEAVERIAPYDPRAPR